MPKHSLRRQPRAPARGVYANYFEVGQTPFEVVIDFGQRYAGKGSAPCHTRIVTSPIYAEALLETLRGALKRHHRHERMVNPLRPARQRP